MYKQEAERAKRAKDELRVADAAMAAAQQKLYRAIARDFWKIYFTEDKDARERGFQKLVLSVNSLERQGVVNIFELIQVCTGNVQTFRDRLEVEKQKGKI